MQLAMQSAAGQLPKVSMDSKSELNQILQKLNQRPVTKTDIIYTTTKFGHQYQAIVKLNCLGGAEYAGSLSPNPKEAEKFAAQQAILAQASTVAAMTAQGAAAAGDKKRKVQKMLTPEEIAAKKARNETEGGNPCITPKTKLNSLCMRITKRHLQKGETTYECLKVAGGYQATVKLTCLPGEWAGRLWAGHVSSTKQKAEQNAAEIALQQITGDKEMSEEASKPKGGGKGGGKGKGKGKGPWGFMPPWMWGWGGGPSGPNLPRERVTPTAIVAEVVEWKDSGYGWVKTSATVDHPAFSQREGKIYVNKKDIVGAETLTQGQSVKLFVYEDPSGLGGEEVTPM